MTLHKALHMRYDQAIVAHGLLHRQSQSGDEGVAASATPFSIPADQQRYPPRCPDPDWCRGSKLCYWHCVARPDDDLEQ